MSTRFLFTLLLIFSMVFGLKPASIEYGAEQEEMAYEEEETAFNDAEVEAMMRINPLISVAKTTKERGELMVSRKFPLQ